MKTTRYVRNLDKAIIVKDVTLLTVYITPLEPTYETLQSANPHINSSTHKYLQLDTHIIIETMLELKLFLAFVHFTSHVSALCTALTKLLTQLFHWTYFGS